MANVRCSESPPCRCPQQSAEANRWFAGCAKLSLQRAVFSRPPTIKQKSPPRSAEGPNENSWLSARSLSRVDGLYAAMLLSVGEVDHQPNHQPNNQPRPVDPPELVHHVAVGDHAEDRDQGHPRSAKGTVQLRMGAPQNQHSDRDDDERKQRSNINHSSNVIDGSQAANYGRYQSDTNRVLPWRSEFRLNRRKEPLW